MSLYVFIWNVGSASPHFIILPPGPPRPMIWVADFPCSIWYVPSTYPNDPCGVGGMINLVTSERFSQKFREVFHVIFRLEMGRAFNPISTPLFRRSPAFSQLVLNPEEEGRLLCIRKS